MRDLQVIHGAKVSAEEISDENIRAMIEAIVQVDGVARANVRSVVIRSVGTGRISNDTMVALLDAIREAWKNTEVIFEEV